MDPLPTPLPSYQFQTNHVTVFVDDAETPFVTAVVDRVNREVTYKYCLASSRARVRVTVASNGARLQGVFRCHGRRMCVVNAHDRYQPLTFDGFIDDDDDDSNEHSGDESRTNRFVITDLNALRPEHGLCVRDMARAMESPSVLQVFVNEAILGKEEHEKEEEGKKDDNVNSNNLANNADLEQLMARLAVDASVALPTARRREHNSTRWARVSCKTGKHLLTINLTFTFST
ncbi:ac17 [Peridroma alphabaculovirus]|uniref:Ac17 n=1 Tax=Peridroma alphabaculovirus TaxID=1346829 RepID=A0A068LMH9_9ABAC|nr:ac17 [Peridroma alphabaculovirus]AIE47756.1 ac17 [Peridroma alphabaculovirus]